MLELVTALVILVPIHGAFWYGIRQERLRQKVMLELALKRRR
jgi:hypothetical protein